MKRAIVTFFLMFLFSPFFISIAVAAEEGRNVTILYTGSVGGTIDALIGCGCNSSGGGGSLGSLARRAHMIESIRKDRSHVLLLDSGSVWGSPVDRANAELHLKAMDRMGYDAMNLGIPELLYGKDFLERSRSQVSLPYVSSNLLYGGARPAWVKEYEIKEIGGIKVAILGILEPEDLNLIPGPGEGDGFQALPPRAVLERLVPEVRAKADIVVLLTQLGELGEKKTRALAKAVPGIDVAIYSERNYLVRPSEKKVIFLQTSTKGTTLGLLTIATDDKRVTGVIESKDVPLDDSVPENIEIMTFVEAYEKEREIQEQKQQKELMEGLKLTPREFMERHRKELN